MKDDIDEAIDSRVDADDDDAAALVRQTTARLVVGLVASAALLGSYVLVVRASGRVVRLVDFLQRNAPLLLLLAAFVVATTWQLVPPILQKFGSRIHQSYAAFPIVLTTGLALCITPALTSWLRARWAYQKIAGVVPWSDSNEYHLGGLRLLHQGQMGPFNMRRPLNAGFYAVRMSLTGQNFWATMLLQGLFVGLAGMLFLAVVARHLGRAACLVAAAVLFAFVGPWIDFTLSESLGVTLGCLAASALWEGVATRHSWLFSLGLLMLTVALNVRSGAYLVLPALLVWFAVDTYRSHLPFWRPVLAATGAVVAGFVLVLPMNALYGTDATSPNDNFSYTLYGLAHGGTGWTAAYLEFDPKDYASEAARTDAVYEAAFDEIRAHPGNLIRGLLSSYKYYFDKGVYGFALNPMSRFLLVLMLVGWIPLIARQESRRLGTMALSAWVGLMFSIPFIFGDGGYRILAGTAPILAIPPAAAVALIARHGRQPAISAAVPRDTLLGIHRSRVIAVACLASLSVLVVGPPIAVALYDSPAVPAVDCPSGEAPVVAEMGRNVAHITLLPPGRDPRNFGEVSIGAFHADPQYSNVDFGRGFTEIEAGSVLVDAYNLLPGSLPAAFVVVPEDQYPGDRTLVALCGRPSDDPVAAKYGLMFTDHLEVLNP